VKIRKINAGAMNQGAAAAKSTRPSARDLQRMEIEKVILDRLTDVSVVLAVEPEDGEKANTLRARILRVAKDRKMDVAVQVHQDGDGARLLVGLMTPERRPPRGRRPKAA
jgi:hypothetical protein